jgi:protein-tyrosine phosphatase
MFDSSVRTSASHPLRIDAVEVGRAGGRIGITFCPGKRGDSLRGAPWERDLDADIDAIVRWGAYAVVTLIEEHEFSSLGVAGLGPAVVARGLTWHHLPIEDERAPDHRFERAWSIVGPKLVGSVMQGGKVLVHCRGGLGRAGTVAARMLVEAGASANDAIARVRAARQGAIETAAQERYIHGLGRPQTRR